MVNHSQTTAASTALEVAPIEPGRQNDPTPSYLGCIDLGPLRD
jgi:hypothetical protein